jgi:hypothetical protein
MSEDREMTYGEQLVGLTFNPSGDEKVQKVKELYAQIIDLVNELPVEPGPSEKLRHIKIAITEAQTAQMWAVKAITFKS